MTQPSSRTRKLETDWFEVKFYQLENGDWGADFRAGTLPSQLQAFKDYQAEVTDRYARSQQIAVLREVREEVNAINFLDIIDSKIKEISGGDSG